MWCDERKWDFIYLFLLLFFLLICVMVFCRSGVQGFDFVFILFGCFYSAEYLGGLDLKNDNHLFVASK